MPQPKKTLNAVKKNSKTYNQFTFQAFSKITLFFTQATLHRQKFLKWEVPETATPALHPAKIKIEKGAKS